MRIKLAKNIKRRYKIFHLSKKYIATESIVKNSFLTKEYYDDKKKKKS